MRTTLALLFLIFICSCNNSAEPMSNAVDKTRNSDTPQVVRDTLHTDTSHFTKDTSANHNQTK